MRGRSPFFLVEPVSQSHAFPQFVELCFAEVRARGSANRWQWDEAHCLPAQGFEHLGHTQEVLFLVVPKVGGAHGETQAKRWATKPKVDKTRAECKPSKPNVSKTLANIKEAPGYM